MAEFLALRDIVKIYGTTARTTALRGVSLSLAAGEYAALIGRSGSGKSTLLNIIGTLDRPTSGEMRVDGRDIFALDDDGLAAFRGRTIGFVFQFHHLLPEFTALENVLLPFRAAHGRTTAAASVRARRLLERVGVGDRMNHKSNALSGGQQQRVAVARALINKPGVLLLDEPLAALDLKLRQRMLIELDMIHDQVGITFLYVTHDQSEAMSLSDRIAVMNAGRIEQIGAPAEIYEAPRTSFVAAFIGDTNFLEGVVADHPEPEYSRLRIEGLPDVTVYNDKQIADGHKIFLSIRPEKIQISRDRPEPKPKRNAVPAVVEDVIYLGPTTKYWVRAGEHRLQVLRQHARFFLDEKPIRWKDDVWVFWHGDDGFMLEGFRRDDEKLVAAPPQKVGEA